MKRYLLTSLLSAFFLAAQGQTTYLVPGSEEYHLLDRLQTLDGAQGRGVSAALKPLGRKEAVAYLNDLKRGRAYTMLPLSSIDQYNIERALSISGEWSVTADGDDGAANSRKPVLKYFYQKQPDLVHVNTGDFFLVVNPVIYAEGMWERHSDGFKYINTRGAELRGRILDRIGFYTLFADNQERPPDYVRQWETSRGAYPGADFYTRHAQGREYDYLLARGYVDIGLVPEHLNITFGYDKLFSGEGMRSLLISDFGAPATFLRLRTRLWKLTYENLFLELLPDFSSGGDRLLPRKYAAIHQLNMEATPWLNVGIFESVMFADQRFRIDNIIPVLFYHRLGSALGSDNRSSLGLNVKAFALRRLQLYGQAYFDRLGSNEGSIPGNRYGLQLGAKYFDAFTLSNLDLQAELNMVRPFTYTSGDGVTNHSHYNQPLAHPYGAAFTELAGEVRYQPLERITLAMRGVYAIRGTDSSGAVNYGNDIFKSAYYNVPEDVSGIAPGMQLRQYYLNINLAYELRPNLFIEGGGTYLRRHYENGLLYSSGSLYGGIRWNISRRQWDGL